MYGEQVYVCMVWVYEYGCMEDQVCVCMGVWVYGCMYICIYEHVCMGRKQEQDSLVICGVAGIVIM